MRILWICNSMLPQVALRISKKIGKYESWLFGLANGLLQNDEIELNVAFRADKEHSIISGEIDNLHYFGFPKELSMSKYTRKIEDYIEKIILKVKPDVIHIFGTEYPHSLAVMHICEKLKILNKVVINIQGLVSIYSQHYCSGLPFSIVNRYTLRDFIKKDNIRSQQKKFVQRGKYEVEALKKAKHIIGRTDWDKACTSQINPSAQYHFCNEILRDEFYKHTWSIDKCERYSIFISQATYPIKGLHFILEALPEIIKLYPDTHLYIAGNDITKADRLISRIKRGSYGLYIIELIEKYNLHKYITFTGLLDEKSMCERFLKSHIFVLPSVIENSPNSLGEAMLSGVPIVSSDVGGVKNMLLHNEEGYVYQCDAPYMMSYYICQIFGNDELALEFSAGARKHASVTHDREKNVQMNVDIYKEIVR